MVVRSPISPGLPQPLSSSPQLLDRMHYLDYSYLSKPLSFSTFFFFPTRFLSWAGSLEQLTLLHFFQPIAEYFFIRRFVAIFPTKASLVQGSYSLLIWQPQYGNTLCFSYREKWRCLPFPHPRSLPTVLLCLISQEGREHKHLLQVLTLLFSLQYLISFQKYMKLSDWHLSHLCTFLLYPGG